MPEPDICRVRHGGNRESNEANEATASSKEYRRKSIVCYLLSRASSTLDEVCEDWNIAPNRISGRFSELKKAGVIEPTGLRRPTRTGCQARLWKVTAFWQARLLNLPVENWPTLIEQKEREPQTRFAFGN